MDWKDKRMMAKVAMLYYLDGMTQEQIAKKYKVSRPVISKLLQRAKEMGIVEIYIKDENVHTINLEQKLEKLFGLTEVIVVSTTGLSDELIKRNIGMASASYLSNNLMDGMKLGISWGTTLEQVVQEFPYKKMKDSHIVPLVGGMGQIDVNIHANQLAYELAKKVNGTCSYLYAPAMVESVMLKKYLIQSENISTVLTEGKNVDIALLGIGDPFEESTMQDIGYLREEDILDLQQAGVVGDINSKFYSKDGQQIKHSLNERVIGIGLEEIKKVRSVIAVANGKYKARSITTAIQYGYIDVLITDDSTAGKIIEEYDEREMKIQ